MISEGHTLWLKSQESPRLLSEIFNLIKYTAKNIKEKVSKSPDFRHSAQLLKATSSLLGERAIKPTRQINIWDHGL